MGTDGVFEPEDSVDEVGVWSWVLVGEEAERVA